MVELWRDGIDTTADKDIRCRRVAVMSQALAVLSRDFLTLGISSLAELLQPRSTLRGLL
jgi:hypothetical protein